MSSIRNLRFLEGMLGWQLGRADEHWALSPEETRLSRGCRALAARLRKIGDALEQMVGEAEAASAQVER
jgi:hypothetical protein